MNTPSLGRRVVVAGVTVVAVTAAGLDVLVFLALRSSLVANLDANLARQATSAQAEARRVGLQALPSALVVLGVEATVRDRNGDVVAGPPPPSGPHLGRTVALADGATVEVAVSRRQMDHDLGRLLRLELIITVLVIALAFFLLRLIADVALRPLDEIAAAMRRRTEGRLGERLRPEPGDTELGLMAAAYDEMLDALEDAVQDARQAQMRSDRMQERDRQILDTASDGFVAVDRNGTIVDWNAEAERAFGWSRAEAVGRPLTTIVPPEHHEAVTSLFPDFAEAGRLALLNRRLNGVAVRRNGARFPVETTAWATWQAGEATFNAFIRDMTERVASQAAISRLAAGMESSAEAHVSMTLDGQVLTWNRGAEVMFGYSAEEVVGEQVTLVVPTPGQPEVAEALAAVKRDEVARVGPSLWRHRDGTLLTVEPIFTPVLDATGSVGAAALIARDISNETRMATELEATMAALATALDEARASEAATRRFLDDAAHQLRAPITGIRACAETLLRGAEPEEEERLLVAVVRESSRATRLMAALLQMARLHQGHKLVRVPCDLLELCREEAERIGRVAPQVEVAVADAGTVPVGQPLLDPQAVAEILANLLDNALRHAVARIDLVVTRTAGTIELSVHDDGPGLPSDATEAVFGRFVSLDGRGGSGLGLPIARDLARAHGGDLTYEAEAGAFVLRLPSGLAD